jgi:hypothetical protein
MRITHAKPDKTRIHKLTLLILLSILLLPAVQPVMAGDSKANAYIEAIGLHEVVDGRKQESIIAIDQLAQAHPLTTQGYISQITFYCIEEGVSATLEGESPSAAQRLKVTKKKPFVWEKTEDRQIKKNYQLAIAPKIAGDCLSVKDELTVSVSTPQGEALDLTIRQRSYRPVFEAPVDRGQRTQPLVFRFLGSGTEQFQSEAAQERFMALTEGIRKIEQAFGQELVQNVNIIDLKGHNNALSLEGKNEFWIYADTFWGYGADELRSAAAHETMHIYVDTGEFTGKPAIRKLYADLMGFGPESKERTTLLVTGHLPRGYASPKKPLAPFWGFINERHFIEGMSGGHSSDNIDEFCTSFLHSLLYIDRLETNLQKSIVIAAKKPPLVMGPADRSRLLQNYRQAVEIFHSEASGALVSDQSPLLEICDLAIQRVDRIASK